MSKRTVDIYSCDIKGCDYSEEVREYGDPDMDFRGVMVETESTDGDYPSNSKFMICLNCVRILFPAIFSNKKKSEDPDDE